ncbi:MAG: MucB/RseB C-terminal domain-containing protein, partial [Candidatus Competibacteraceae bacterium]|nr:MucB/RseB C-terminal domain-containing protein [Candidatus Competibacteraceae bacterium]
MDFQRLLWALALLTGLMAAAGATQQDDANSWLERMNWAVRHLNYEGTFVYVQGQSLAAMHILHAYDEEGERQKLSALNGATREVVVSDDRITSVLPQRRISLRGPESTSPLHVSLPQELGELEEYYHFKVLGKDRVAGLTTQVIAIQPRDQLRFGYRLWLEQETALVLRSALLDDQGRVIEQLMFTELELKSEIDQGLLTASGGQQHRPQETATQAVEHSPWVIEELPAGFEKVFHTRFSGHHGDRTTEHILLTDGLATISVFVEPLQGAKPLLEGGSQMGAMNAFGTVVADHQVLVVGEVPQST